MSLTRRLSLPLAAGVALAVGLTAPAHAIKKGGVLTFVVGSKIPSFDGHQETTFGMIHPIRPFYSLLIRVNPDNPQSPTDFQCDICEGAVPTATDDGKTYTFKIRKGVEFHNGEKLSSADVLATYNKIIFPPKGVQSSRKAFFGMVKTVTAPDATTLVFKLKYATSGFLPALALPFNFIYAKADLDKHGYSWHQKNINGTGAFQFVQHQPGAFVEGKRFDKYHHKGKPYLDGFKAISAPKMALRVQAIRGDRASIEFRGFPPKTRDDLVRALGKGITVQESDWNCLMGAGANHKKEQFQDPRVRRALSLALDRWGGSKYLRKIAIVKTVGGIVFPTHPMAATKEELLKMTIFNPDNKTRRALAKKLLKEAGKSDLAFVLWNRAVDQPYKVVGTWMIDQWKQVGLKATQAVVPSGPWYAGLRKKQNFDVAIDFNCQSVINPVVDAAKFISSDKTGNNYMSVKDRMLDKWYDEMNREGDPKKARALMRKFEHRVLEEQANFLIAFWWYKINPHRSYVKGWKIAPSHYLNQHLDQVWLDK